MITAFLCQFRLVPWFAPATLTTVILGFVNDSPVAPFSSCLNPLQRVVMPFNF